MTAISSFLGIDFNKTLLLPSLNSNNLTDIREKINNEMSDNPKNYLSDVQINFLRFIFGQYKIKESIYNKITFNLIYYKLLIFSKLSF